MGAVGKRGWRVELPTTRPERVWKTWQKKAVIRGVWGQGEGGLDVDIGETELDRWVAVAVPWGGVQKSCTDLEGGAVFGRAKSPSRREVKG